MFSRHTDIEWEKFGKTDPYFGVVSHDKYRRDRLTDESREEFFESGSVYINQVLAKIRCHIEPDFTIKRALDFGCGVGRLVIPLSRIAQKVTGVDVSASMLDEAKRNCEARSIGNVTLVKSDDSLSLVKGKYDFIHSYIVFQHIPVARGQRIFERLIALLESGGVCVVHFTYANADAIRKTLKFVRRYVPLSGNVFNLVKGKSFFSPQMQMNGYDLNRLFLMMQRANVADCYMQFTNHGGELGIVVYFRNPASARQGTAPILASE